MKFSGLILLLLSAFAPIVAMAEYWVSIASFKNRDGAEAALVNAQRKIEESLKVLGAATEKGYFFRIVAGPFETQNQAKDAQDLLGLVGLNQGWVWRGKGVGAVARGTQDFNGSTDFERLELDRDWETGPVYEDDFDFTPEDSFLPEAIEPAQDPLPEIPKPHLRGISSSKEARAPPLEPLNFLFSLSQTRPNIPPSSAPVSSMQPNSTALNVITFSRTACHSCAQDLKRDDIEVDGRLDEAIWRELAGADGFLVSDPETLAEPAYTTIVKAFYTDDRLYVGVDMEQPRATLIRRLSSRDGRRINRDAVGSH